MKHILSMFSYLFRRLTRSAGGIRYTIGGKVYRQRPLVLLQIEQLSAFLEDVRVPSALGVVGIVQALGDRLADALAIVLIPEGVELDQKDLQATAAHLRANVDVNTAVKVVEDFLSCNPLGWALGKLRGAMARVRSVLQEAGSQIS